MTISLLCDKIQIFITKEDFVMEIIYVLAISLQVCGALILLIHSFGNKQTEINNEIINSVSTGEQQTQTHVDNIDVSYKLKDIYLNRVAFICLTFGYFLGVFGEISTVAKWVIALSVVIISCLITVFFYFLCEKLANKRQKLYKDNYKKDYQNYL